MATAHSVHPSLAAIFRQIAEGNGAVMYIDDTIEGQDIWAYDYENLRDVAVEFLTNISEIIPSFALPSPDLLVQHFLENQGDANG